MGRFFDLLQLAALACFLGMFVGRWLHQGRARGVRVMMLGRGKGPLQAALELGMLAGLLVWITEVVAYAVPLRFHLVPAPLGAVLVDALPVKLLGALLVLAGLVLFAAALRAFGDSWRVGIDPRTPGELVTRGIFACSRNPIYLFLDLYFAGTFLMSGRLVFLLAAAGAAAMLHLQIRQEERFLEHLHGEAYREYRARVARYLGW